MAKYKQSVDLVLRGRTQGVAAAFKTTNQSLTVLSSKLVRLRTMAISTFGAYTIVRGLGALTSAALQFQKQMAEVHTMLRNGGERFLPTFTKQVRALSIEFGQSTKTIAAGLYDILSAGISAEGAMRVLRASLISATGGLTDLQTAAYGATSIINAYGLAAEDATHVNDLLFAVVEQGKIRFAELSAEIGKVVSVARAAGISLEDTMAMIAAIVRVEEPARGITALRAAIMNAAASGKDFVETVKSLEGATLPMIKLAGFARRAGVGIAIMTGDMQNLNNQLEIMGNVTGKSMNAANKIMQTMYFNGEQLKQLFADLTRVMGEEVAKSIIDLGMAFKGNREELENYSRTIGKTIGWVIKLVQEHHKLIIGLLLFGSAIKVAAAFTAVVRGMSTAYAMLVTRKLADTTATIVQNAATTKYIVTKGQLYLATALVTKAKFLENIQTKLGISLALGNARAVKVLTAAKAGLLSIINPLTIAFAAAIVAYTVYTRAINKAKEAQQGFLDWQERINRSMKMVQTATTPGGKAAGFEQMEKEHSDELIKKQNELNDLTLLGSIFSGQIYARQKRRILLDIRALKIARSKVALLNAEAQEHKKLEDAEAARLEKLRIAYKASALGIWSEWLEKNEKTFEMGRDLEIKYLEDAEEKALEISTRMWGKKWDQAMLAGRDQAEITVLWLREEFLIKEKFARKETEMQNKEQEKRLKIQKSAMDDIQRIMAKGMTQGLEQRLLLLRIEEQEAIRIANKAGAFIDEIEAKFALLRQIAAQNIKDPGLGTTSFREAPVTTRAPGFADPIKILRTTQKINLDQLVIAKSMRTHLENIENAIKSGDPLPTYNPP